jgi:hypothetical protein
MPLFGKPLKAVTLDDLTELVGNAYENVRLEFKSNPVKRDDYLKKLSSFANTSGGYLILGMVEGDNNIAKEICGVPKQPSFEAQVTSWCAQGLYPPVVPHVSNPIQLNGDKFCYVIYVEESDLAPHFIEGRQGCYVRTNETSHKFEAQLATQTEIQALLNRRADSVQLAKELLARSEKRIAEHEARLEPEREYSGFLPLTVRVAPKYPRKGSIALKDLAALAGNSCIQFGPNYDFPALTYGVNARTDSLLATQPRGDRSFVELTRYGTMSYTEFFEGWPREKRVLSQELKGIQFVVSMPVLLGAILLGLRYGRNFCNQAIIYGSLEISVSLRTKVNVGYFMFDQMGQGYSAAVLSSNDHITLTRETHVQELQHTWVALAEEMWLELYYSLGWRDAYTEYGPKHLAKAKESALGWLRTDASFYNVP